MTHKPLFEALADIVGSSSWLVAVLLRTSCSQVLEWVVLGRGWENVNLSRSG
jgi:hypothetical protein